MLNIFRITMIHNIKGSLNLCVMNQRSWYYFAYCISVKGRFILYKMYST